ncbi:hypothetical protein JCM3774_006207 [Rhodotorula dairenensis]
MTETSSITSSSSADKADAGFAARVIAAVPTPVNHGDAAHATPASDGVIPPPKKSFSRPWHLSETTKNVLKCVLAYAIGSLFTFVPALSDFLGTPWDVDGPVRNAHLVATVAVYFSPGRTVGAMIETDLYLLVAAVSALVLMAGSLATAVALESLDATGVAHFLIPMWWIGVGYGLLAYAKTSVNKPSFSTACSLVSMACSPVITKEGAFHLGRLETASIEQIMLIILLGSCISNFVCFVAWPQRAADKLCTRTTWALESVSAIFDALCESFLTGTEVQPGTDTQLAKLQSSLADLKDTLSHAEYEAFLPHARKRIRTLDQILTGLARLGQSLSGLRACCETGTDGSEGGEQPVDGIKKSLGQLRDEVILFLGACSRAVRSLEYVHGEQHVPSLDEAFRDLRESLTNFRQTHPDSLADLYRSTLSPENEDWLFRTYQFCYNVESGVHSTPQYIYRQTIKALRVVRPPPTEVFPIVQDAALTSHLLDPETAPRSTLSRLKLRLWRLGHYCSAPGVRFALKTGTGAAVLSAAAFDSRLRPHWLAWRGEWALISYMVIMAPALGATNFLALARIIGTACGAAVALVTFKAFSQLPLALTLMGASVSAPCFWLAIAQPHYATSARFTLLAYNLTCLYAFNLREVNVPIDSIAFRRFVAVSAGVLWALIVNGYIWPYEARRELRRVLSEFFLDTAYYYQQIIRSYSTHQAVNGTVQPHPVHEETPLLSGRDLESIPALYAMEDELQRKLLLVGALLDSTRHEPRLKGPFPIPAYRLILSSCRSILSSLTAIARMVEREKWLVQVRRDFVAPVSRERREMVGNVTLFLSLLSSSTMLKTPLPAYLPPAELARRRLLAALRDLDVVKERTLRHGASSLIYYAYVIMMADLIRELEELGRSLQSLYGVVGGGSSDDFEALFAQA